MSLQDYRKEIDAIDDELVRLFGQRMEVAAKIADYKKGCPSVHKDADKYGDRMYFR